VKIKKISDQLSVADQITKNNVSDITKAGFKSIICNRPDGEVPGQPAFKDIEQAAIKANLPIRYLPAVSGAVTPQLGQEFGKIWKNYLSLFWLTAARACAAQLCGPFQMPKLWIGRLWCK